MKKLWYRKPAHEWNEALPLGNGRLGAMVFGGVGEETVSLNEDSLWSGKHGDRNNRDAAKYRDQIRNLLFAGKIREAETLTRYAMTGSPRNETNFQTAGSLCIETGHTDAADYFRELDLDRAAAAVSYRFKGVGFRRELFVSAVDQALVIRFTADRPASISFSSCLMREGMLDYLTPASTEDETETVIEGGTGIRFCVMQKAVVKGGTLSKIGDYLIVDKADEALLFVAAATSFREKRYRECVENILRRAAVKDYEQLLADHIGEYRSYFTRMTLDLGGDPEKDRLPTDERLDKFSEAGNDNGLFSLYFDFGRYLLISSSRPGSLPANLQGIWNKELAPPWGSKYTININTEMNYWPAESCNLSDCHAPLFELLGRMRKNGRVTAREMYHARGFLAHHNTDIWGDTAPQDQYMPATYWVMGAAWLCTHLWQHYEYTEDLAFLGKYYPLMRDAALFFVDYLTEDPEGRLIVCPTVSPENQYLHPNTGEAAYISAGSTMDSQILRDLFSICIRSSGLLGRDKKFARTLAGMLKKLPETQIHSNGTIKEWLEEYREVEIGHRHISHLYGLYPSSQISPIETPELAQAARKTLERRLANGGGHTGWSRAWIINFWARLLDGEQAYEHLKLLLIRSTLPNLLDNHPPFQIDGNFGATAGIAEMLVQCVSGRLILLPALPAAWPRGSVEGLKAKGNLTLSMRWEEGRLAELSIDAVSERRVCIRYRGKETEITLRAGKNSINPELLL